MIAHASLLRPSTKRRLTLAQIRYEAPADLLPWADPYIASLFDAEQSSGSCSSQFSEEDSDDRYTPRR